MAKITITFKDGAMHVECDDPKVALAIVRGARVPTGLGEDDDMVHARLMLIRLEAAGSRGVPGKELATLLGSRPRGIGHRIGTIKNRLREHLVGVDPDQVVEHRRRGSGAIWRLGPQGRQALAALADG